MKIHHMRKQWIPGPSPREAKKEGLGTRLVDTHPNNFIISYLCADIKLFSVERYEGQVAEFPCSTTAVVSSLQWIVNGSALEDLSMDTSILTSSSFAGEFLTFRNVPLHYNGTTIQCVVTFPDNTTLSSNTATLQVQGDHDDHYNVIDLNSHDHSLQVYWMLFLMRMWSLLLHPSSSPGWLHSPLTPQVLQTLPTASPSLMYPVAPHLQMSVNSFQQTILQCWS